MVHKHKKHLKQTTRRIAQVSKTPHFQKGGTCYANAIATVLRAVEAHMPSREVEPHQAIVQRLVEQYGQNGANTFDVLRKECKKKNLRCKFVSAKKAETAIREGRALIMIFHMSAQMWDDFYFHFRKQPNGIFEIRQYDGAGHAAVINGMGQTFWKCKNSWGYWADEGYFRIDKKSQVRYIDVFLDQKDRIEEQWLIYQASLTQIPQAMPVFHKHFIVLAIVLILVGISYCLIN